MRRMPTDEQLKIFDYSFYNEDDNNVEIGTNLYVDGAITSGTGIYSDADIRVDGALYVTEASNTGDLHVYQRGVTNTEWNNAGEIKFTLPYACNVKWIKISNYSSYDKKNDYYVEGPEPELIIPFWGTNLFLHCYKGVNTNDVKILTVADGCLGQDMAGINISAYLVGSNEEENYITLEATQQLPVNLVVKIGYTTDNTISYSL